MDLFSFLKVSMPELTAEDTKIHFAAHNGTENPLDVFLAGEFDLWQQYQTRRNFNRPYVIGLIPLAAEDRYLFTGVYHVKGMREQEEGVGYFYDLEPEDRVLEYAGRLVIDIVFRDRARYRYAESLSDRLKIAEFKEEKLSLSDFPGYHNVDISKNELDMIIRQNIPTWRGALESVAGIYLISDTQNGQLYVGSATGLGGIYSRWATYAATGHGGNVLLKALLDKEETSASAFRYSIQEIADTHASHDDILKRESHWKRILLSRSHGLNAN